MGHSTFDQERPAIIKFTNCRILRGNDLVESHLWISSETGKILNGQDVFYSEQIGPSQVIDLQGRIVSPGFIETQINGAYGFDFSEDSNNPLEYAKGVATLRRGLVETGVTSFLPTITSQKSEVYKKVNLIRLSY
jgi:N-acetylglucosamine-6-phosphate deacetylase